jgi:ABC-type transport system involved in multi-copper enzyme maturation permease subunit
MKILLEIGPMHLSKTNTLKMIFELAWLRVRLLLRQKLGWLSIGVGVALVFLSLVTAQVSWVNPQKIFWDFSLAVIFVLQISLAVFLGTQLFHDEKNRRTLHLLLSSGVSRTSWAIGNGLGIFAGLSAMAILWFVVTLITDSLAFEGLSLTMPLQTVLLLIVEVLVVVFFSMLLSFLLRPLLALAVSSSLVIFLHSLESLERIFTDPNVGRFVDKAMASYVLEIAKVLPPLHWLDLKSFVGYEASLPWIQVGQLGIMGVLWAGLCVLAASLRFERMDL